MENLEPKTRIEAYLAKIAGEDIITPEVKTRLEYYLNEIAQNGGGGGAGLPAVTEADNGKVLGVVGGEWDKMDKGWNVTNIYNTFVEEQTVAVTSNQPCNEGVILNPSENELVEGQTYTVIIDGVEYTLRCQSMEGMSCLGEFNGDQPDLTNYPFFIIPNASDTLDLFTTLDVGNHTIEIDRISQGAQTTSDFDLAVQSVITKNVPLMVYGGFVDGDPCFMDGDDLKYTYQQLADIIDSGRVVYLRLENTFVTQVANSYEISDGTSFNNVVPIIRENNTIKARFVFYATIANDLVICVIDMEQLNGATHATTWIHKSSDHEE